MRRLLPLLTCLALLACNGDDTDTDTDPGTDPDTEPDTDPPPVDKDEDGYKSDVDCNDADYRIHPDAPEICDGIDQDCDELIDEDFDNDGDGFDNPIDCPDGDDCNDDDPATYPGAPEIPYDGIDQDCDDADLEDVDGDGYRATEVGSVDCDDTDASIHPNAPEIAKDGIDQDCDGLDLLDGDGDGFDDVDFGGDDCDDDDPDINPDALDWWNDGIDSDCDTIDGRVIDLSEITTTVLGASASTELLGNAVVVCDQDGDGYDDVIVTAPFASSYAGKIGVFYGSAAPTWTADMAISTADAVISGASGVHQFFGFGVECADFDGDGYLDLAVGRGEINYPPTYDTTFSVSYLYGDGTALSGSYSDTDFDAVLEYPLGTPNITTVYSRTLRAGDVDADGASELFMLDFVGGYSTTTGGLLQFSSGRFTDGDLMDYLEGQVDYDAEDGGTSFVVLDDVDGDGTCDIALGQTGESGSTSTDWAGRVDLFGSPSGAGDAVADIAWAGLTGENDDLLGGGLAFGDFDGDGATDVATGAYLQDANGRSGTGALYVFSDVSSLSGESAAADAYSAWVYGEDRDGGFGRTLYSHGTDVDGDGYDDLLVRAFGGSDTVIYVLSGALMTGDVTADDATLLKFQGEQSGTQLAVSMATGDLNGDGRTDLVLGDRYFWVTSATTYSGKAYIILAR